ncbi:germin-like protein [Musa troglodytarum]|uniref:Germin-like protein n=1 Tax=Musa troglodytarum TaxID=320322 RepID=A0A9E7K0M7_9LILI|nr:germin-like protein [Musa troglodytarum]
MELRCAKLSFAFFLSFTLLLASTRADPHPLQDFCVADFGATAVVVNGFPCKPVSNVTMIPANVLNFAGLNTLGISMNRIDVIPDGLNLPHNHPRATKLIILLEGRLLALAITTFDSQLPGVVIASTTLFGSTPAIPDDVLAKAFQVDQKVVTAIKSKFAN